MYREHPFRGRHSNGLERRYFDLRKGGEQLVVRLETRDSVKKDIYANLSIARRLILRTNRLIGFIEEADRGIIKALQSNSCLTWIGSGTGRTESLFCWPVVSSSLQLP